ncbi:helix-turn-helix domain-containing protein [Escherichia coli]|uniref:helix-turn-helix domain-containing protein n=1 Tax=Escherichia coli TaxID=562 RepID=UPI001F10044A|nr:helix-turn-helix domain-containing protein [Escherichia coli]MCH4796080.1 ArsR family transcriptional regulator [Escherichia coli]MCT7386786.1 ArsR family transcriptional regulator [Escherichia coli]
MYQSATAYVAKPGETLVKHKIATLQALQTLQALPEQVQAAFRDGMNIIRFDGYRWEYKPATGFVRIDQILSPANEEPALANSEPAQEQEQNKAAAIAEFKELQRQQITAQQEECRHPLAMPKPVAKANTDKPTSWFNEEAEEDLRFDSKEEQLPEEREQVETEDQQNDYRNLPAVNNAMAYLFKSGLFHKLKGDELKLYTWMVSKCRYRGNDKYEIWYSRTKMAKALGKSVDTIDRHLEALRKLGLIQEMRQALRGKCGKTYRLRIPSKGTAEEASMTAQQHEREAKVSYLVH